MLRFWIHGIIAALGCCLGWGLSAAQAADELEIYRDSRAIRDVALLKFDQVSAAQPWVLAEITPDPMSFAGIAPGAWIKTKTGRIVKPPGAHSAIMVFGSLRIIGTVAGTPPNLSEYEWAIVEHPPRGDDSEDNQRHSPFHMGGGTALFRINEKREAAARFYPVYQIPAEWSKFVAPALRYYQTNAELFRSEAVAESREQLSELLTDDNPLLAAAAARTLGEARSLDTAFTTGPLAQSRDFRQAIFTFLALRYMHPQRGIALIEEIGRVIDAAVSADKLTGIALGAYATFDTGTFSDDTVPRRTREAGLELLRRVDKKQSVLGSRTPADTYVGSILKRAGLRRETAGRLQEPKKQP